MNYDLTRVRITFGGVPIKPATDEFVVKPRVWRHHAPDLAVTAVLVAGQSRTKLTRAIGVRRLDSEIEIACTVDAGDFILARLAAAPREPITLLLWAPRASLRRTAVGGWVVRGGYGPARRYRTKVLALREAHRRGVHHAAYSDLRFSHLRRGEPYGDVQIILRVSLDVPAELRLRGFSTVIARRGLR